MSWTHKCLFSLKVMRYTDGYCMDIAITTGLSAEQLLLLLIGLHYIINPGHSLMGCIPIHSLHSPCAHGAGIGQLWQFPWVTGDRWNEQAWLSKITDKLLITSFSQDLPKSITDLEESCVKSVYECHNSHFIQPGLINIIRWFRRQLC